MTFLINLLLQYGLALVFLNVLIEQAGLPIPAYPTLIVAGAYVAPDTPSILALLGTGVAAAVIADSAWYLAGRSHGMRVLRMLCKVSLSPDSCVTQTESIFVRYGAPSMLFAKFIPGFASVATAMAGAIGMRYPRFLLFDTLGAVLWVSVAIALGQLFRDAIAEMLATLEDLGKYGLALLAVALVAYIASKWWRRRQFIRQLRMDRVSVDQLREMMDGDGPTTILDVRSPLVQAASGRIPGARAIDLERIHEGVDDVSRDGEVIVYCACPNEATAVKVAQALQQIGFRRVRPLLGGIDAWIAAGHDVEPVTSGARTGVLNS